MAFVYWILFFVMLGLCEGQMSGPPPPPEEEQWVLNFDSPVYVCSDDISKKLADTSDVEVQRHNETVAYMHGKFEFLQAIEPCTLVELIVEKEKNGRLEVMLTHDLCDLCEEVNPDSAYYKYLKYFIIPETCPFDAGVYEINEFIPPRDELPINAPNAGWYIVTLNFYKNPACNCKDERIFIGCLKLSFVIEPLD